jgi:hypothetical protein
MNRFFLFIGGWKDSFYLLVDERNSFSKTKREEEATQPIWATAHYGCRIFRIALDIVERNVSRENIALFEAINNKYILKRL